MQHPQNHSETVSTRIDISRAVSIAVFCALLAGCGNPQESARKELAKLGKDFSPPAFIESINNNDKQAVRLFIEAGFNVNAADDNGITPLAVAAMKGDTDLVRILLEKGANPNAAMTSRAENGVTPLMGAATSGNIEVVKLLMDKGAKVNTKDDRGLVALDYAKGQTNLAILDALWDHGAPYVTDAALSKLLERFRFDLHSKAARSMIAGDSPDGVQKFIAEQLVNFQTVQRFTTNQLIEARVCAFRTVSSVVEKSAMEERINASGAIGSNEKNLGTIKEFTGFLKELQSDPAVQTGALLRAAECGEAGIINWLLKQGANVNTRDDQGFTPLTWAAFKGQPDAIQILLEAGADVNAKDHSGWTAIMWAASQGRVDALKMILAKSPDVNAVNNDGKTALAIATAMNRAAAAVVLKEAGAKQ